MHSDSISCLPLYHAYAVKLILAKHILNFEIYLFRVIHKKDCTALKTVILACPESFFSKALEKQPIQDKPE